MCPDCDKKNSDMRDNSEKETHMTEAAQPTSHTPEDAQLLASQARSSRGGAYLGYFIFINNSGSTLNDLYVRHLLSNRIDGPGRAELKLPSLRHGDRSNKVEFLYDTGIFASFDYWYIEATQGKGMRYYGSHNFYCSVSSSDDGYVYITLDRNMDVHFKFSQSSGCWTDLRPYPW